MSTYASVIMQDAFTGKTYSACTPDAVDIATTLALFARGVMSDVSISCDDGKASFHRTSAGETHACFTLTWPDGKPLPYHDDGYDALPSPITSNGYVCLDMQDARTGEVYNLDTPDAADFAGAISLFAKGYMCDVSFTYEWGTVDLHRSADGSIDTAFWPPLD